MRNIWVLAQREVKTFFDSLVAYILLVLFLGFTGGFTWFYGSDIFMVGQASLNTFFEIAYWSLFILAPAITMRMIAEENRTGTLEVLLTRAVSDWQVVVGKYLSCMILIGITLLFTLPYYFGVAWLGPVDHSAVWCGYLGLLLMSSVYISIGLFASSISNNQIVALLIGLIFCTVFHFIFGTISFLGRGVISEFFEFLSMQSHFQSISRGVIDLRDIVYFVSISLLFLILAEYQLAKRNVID